MKGVDPSMPVVVLGFQHGALGIARSLGRLGISVYGVDRDLRAPGLASRYCREAVRWDLDGAPATETVDFLCRLAQRIDRRSLLVPTTDRSASLVAGHADVLADYFVFPKGSADLVRSLHNKRELFYQARRLGISTPAAVFPQSRDDVLRFLSDAVFPIMLKAIDGTRLMERTGKRMVIVHSVSEVLEQYTKLEDPEVPNLMLQEYIPGGDDTIWMFNGYFNDVSECLCAFTGRKLRQHPVHTGATTLGICVRNETVERLTTSFMKTVGYHGILDIGYRYDARDGTYKLLDANPRIGSTFRLFVAENGMDVARCLYLDMTGQPVPRAVPIDGRKWVVEDQDFLSCLDYRREGQLTLRQWFGSLRGIDEAAWFARDDLVPGCLVCLGFVHRLFRRAAKKSIELSRPRRRAREEARQGDRAARGVGASGAPQGVAPSATGRAGTSAMASPAATGCGVERLSLTDAISLGPEAWDGLLAPGAAPNPFMSWAWYEAWSAASGTAEVAASEAIVVRSAAGAVEALFPFRVHRVRFRRAPVTALGWATGDLGCPDHVDVLASPAADLALLVPALEALSWDVILLDNVAGDAPNGDRLCAAWADRGWTVRRIALWDCPYLQLPDSWAAYLSGLSANRRQTLGRKERKLRREHRVGVTCYGPDRLEEGWGHLLRLHALRWGRAGVFHDATTERLHRCFTARLAQRGDLWLTTLDLDDTPAAAWYGFSFGRTVYYYQGGWDPAWERHSVGTVLMGTMIRRAIEEGYQTFDFLRGDESYKRTWTETVRPTYQIAVIRPGWRGGVLRALDWVARLREARQRRSVAHDPPLSQEVAQ